MKDADLLLELILQMSLRDGNYIDVQPALLSCEGLLVTGRLINQVIEEHAPVALSIGGLATGAISLAVAAACASNGVRSAFWVRKDPKGRERLPWFAGHPVGPVVLVDDVVRTGRSLMRAVEHVRKQGVFVVLAVGLVDMEECAMSLLTSHKVPYTFVYSKRNCCL
jgi:orotate phosphoribosyltransferase